MVGVHGVKSSTARIRDFSLPQSKKPTGKIQALTNKAVREERLRLEAAVRTRLRERYSQSLPADTIVADDGDSMFVDEVDHVGAAAQQILDGSWSAGISHAGGEVDDLLREAVRDVYDRRDRRTRRNRVALRNAAFEGDMHSIIEAYMLWDYERGQKASQPPQEANEEEVTERAKQVTVEVLDVFGTFRKTVTLLSAKDSPTAALVREGCIPSAPTRPKFAATIRLVELYHNLTQRCPHLAIQPFLKGLGDLQGATFRHSRAEQFSVCYDVFLAARNACRERVLTAVGRTGNWRLKNACSACCYRVDGEPKLLYSMLVVMDGNNSLKRMASYNAAGQPNARDDFREVGGDYYIARECVDGWSKEVMKDATGSQEPDKSTAKSCSARWTNMSEQATSKMWGVFDETGIFIALCRHGFVLLLTDMVRSGELAKYPLAVVESLLEAFEPDVCGGYDIGCGDGFVPTLDNSPLGLKSRASNYRSIVGAFHGHAHNRLCQLSYHPTYRAGAGLEDFEGSERFFSKSNALASSTRYASRFHRQQRIFEYARHTDAFETFPNLSKFITNNYLQALEIIGGEGDFLLTLQSHDINDASVLATWLVEEEDYLRSLSKEPLQETLEMDYLKKLKELRDTSAKLEAIHQKSWSHLTPQSVEDPQRRDTTLTEEATRRHAQEKYDATLDAVQRLEVRMVPEKRWDEGSIQWAAAEELVGKRAYQRALDHLESLVVSRLLELTKMNMANTGYKLRQQISHALQSRSQAVRTAIDQYNKAATELTPPQRQLSWDEVVQYGFLSDFDLLRESRQDIRDKVWAKPSSRLLLDRHYKILRAREEIERLNVEIRRVVAHLQEESDYLLACEAVLKLRNPVLSYHVSNYRSERTRSRDLHLQRFKKLSEDPRFTGSLEIPTSRVPSFCRPPTPPQVTVLDSASKGKAKEPQQPDTDDEEDEDGGGDEVDELTEKVLAAVRD